MYSGIYKSPIGALKVTVFSGAVVSCGFVSFDKIGNCENSGFLAMEKDDARSCLSPPNPIPLKENRNEIVLRQALQWLQEYFSPRSSSEVMPPLFLSLSSKTQEFLNAIKKTHFGAVCTYGQMARICNTHARSIGQACARNPIVLFIPCHRIVSNSCKNMHSYSQGEHRKKWLINFEHKTRKLKSKTFS